MAAKRKTTTTVKQPTVDEILNRPLPKEALKELPHKRNSKGECMTSITPIYVTDRLNEAFGLGGWQFEPEIISDSEKMVIIKGVLTVSSMNIRVVQFGGNDNRDRGDAYKGAATDALTKCASYLGVGSHVWRDNEPREGHSVETKPAKDKFKKVEELEKILEKHEKVANEFLAEIEWIEKKQTFRDLTDKRAKEILDRPADFLASLLKVKA